MKPCSPASSRLQSALQVLGSIGAVLSAGTAFAVAVVGGMLPLERLVYPAYLLWLLLPELLLVTGAASILAFGWYPKVLTWFRLGIRSLRQYTLWLINWGSRSDWRRVAVVAVLATSLVPVGASVDQAVGLLRKRYALVKILAPRNHAQHVHIARVSALVRQGYELEQAGMYGSAARVYEKLASLAKGRGLQVSAHRRAEHLLMHEEHAAWLYETYVLRANEGRLDRHALHSLVVAAWLLSSDTSVVGSLSRELSALDTNWEASVARLVADCASGSRVLGSVPSTSGELIVFDGTHTDGIANVATCIPNSLRVREDPSDWLTHYLAMPQARFVLALGSHAETATTSE